MNPRLTWIYESGEGGFGGSFIPAVTAGAITVDGRWPLVFANGDAIPDGEYVLVETLKIREGHVDPITEDEKKWNQFTTSVVEMTGTDHGMFRST